MRGVVTTITDFVPNEAVLVMPLEFQSSNGSVDVPITFEIVQADDGTYTDVFFQPQTPRRQQQPLRRPPQYACWASSIWRMTMLFRPILSAQTLAKFNKIAKEGRVD